VTAVEALLRWQHPEDGLLCPGAFLEAAEDSGLIVPIGEWTLQTACRQAAAWRDRRPGTAVAVWVNLSGRQLAQPDLPAIVAAALAEAGLSAEHLGFEITEGVLMEDVPTTIHRLDALEQLGVRLIVDDFGTGYSSLAYLQRFPIHVLKVDRSFVESLATEHRSGGGWAIVNTITRLADSLGMTSVAEGIETEEQLSAVRGIGVQVAQGFLLGAPGPAAEFDRAREAAPSTT
jgi:EAL domain-containing protein (putative c-di-GMP-specific phosphodiesterase class I)